jgi:hypothetical protein
MNETKKNSMVMIAFFALIMWMAIYYSITIQKKLQSPISYFQTQQQGGLGQIAGLN